MQKKDFMVNLQRAVVEDYNSILESYEWDQKELTQIKNAPVYLITDVNFCDLIVGFPAIMHLHFSKLFFQKSEKFIQSGKSTSITKANGGIIVSENYSAYIELDASGIVFRKSKLDFATERKVRELIRVGQLKETFITIDPNNSNREIYHDNLSYVERKGKTRKEALFIRHVSNLINEVDSVGHLLYIFSELDHNGYKHFKNYNKEEITLDLVRSKINDSLSIVEFSMEEDVTKYLGFELS